MSEQTQDKALAIEVRFFGAFRKFGGCVQIHVTPGSCADDIKQQLVAELGEDSRALIADSVLADEANILPGAYVIREATTLSILPPVCGG